MLTTVTYTETVSASTVVFFVVVSMIFTVCAKGVVAILELLFGRPYVTCYKFQMLSVKLK